METRKYATPADFRKALEDRLQMIARNDNVDLQRVRREVAFDRLLARLFATQPGPWVLKGGYAMELRIGAARSTRDVDVTLRGRPSVNIHDPEQRNLAVLDLLQEYATIDLSDYFDYVIGVSMLDMDSPGYGGARFPVEARIDGRRFVSFHIDVAVSDVLIEPFETMEGRDWLSFAGIPQPSFQSISAEQQFAEKFHAYTLPRQNPNSRVRDLVDMLLLVESGKLSPESTARAIRTTFEKRNTHQLPAVFVDPPSNWAKPFAALAAECGISTDVAGSAARVKSFFELLSLKK